MTLARFPSQARSVATMRGHPSWLGNTGPNLAPAPELVSEISTPDIADRTEYQEGSRGSATRSLHAEGTWATPAMSNSR
jgi:hypothetical protein